VILVDSFGWIAHLQQEQTPATARLYAAADREPRRSEDLILPEVLQGARDEMRVARNERSLRRYPIVPLPDPDLASRSA
jgi:hypothetical protein